MGNHIVLTVPFLLKLLLNTVIIAFFFLLFRSYRGVLRYFSITDGRSIFMSVLSTAVTMVVLNFFTQHLLQYTILVYFGFVINFGLTLLFLYLFRTMIQVIYHLLGNGSPPANRKIPILIFDISSTMISTAEMLKKSSTHYIPVGFISSDKKAVDKLILGLPVFSMSDKDSVLIKNKLVQALLINPAEQDIHEKETIAGYCEKNRLKILSIPAVSDYQKRPSIDKIRNIQIEDLLGRTPISIAIEEIGENLRNKCVMVTGAAGSIGSEIVHQIACFQPGLVLLCDIAETPLHALQLEIQEKFPELHYMPLLCDVRNRARMEQIFKVFRPSHVYHAAAYKHVPLMESHPCESIHTNVSGTKNIADLSVKYRAEVLVMISTDKAVNPTNVMGASKRIAEIYVQSLYKYLKANEEKYKNPIRIITTRFGNVLGSNGSVIPLFKEQIEKGGPVTVTHPDIIRYFMTIPEACRLVLEAANMGKGGEIFVFDMGEPVKIVDLAEKMIRLSGLKPYEDIPIVFTGLRPGEKLYEELLADEEITQKTYNKNIMIGTVRDDYEYEELKSRLAELCEAAVNHVDKEVVRIMKEIIPEYISANSIYELLDEEVFAN
ncbi:capsular polysaccharide biosynthesis protein [Bacteroidia bacterium]|nr:capsular polysaccharide biosynthesis protein [Bacteroidia bacterium]